ncbi:hypothetical protein B0H67DRAFT_645677 [Lasiosphaeris hirsuta]|uniref:Uncharacterized protein n=1 Tax=Lasiosphaeris hirsuta TaxID=260670 RepID=A0AA40DTS0_9PEZI|nr:hypothetical protein B0H67DRAFT_645677 [Lasiosphaeris hirsuta]
MSLRQVLSLAALLALPLCSAQERQFLRWRSPDMADLSGEDVFRRQTPPPGYHPEFGTCGSGTTCENACGGDWLSCRASTELSLFCYNKVQLNQTCCENGSGRACDNGYYCAWNTFGGKVWCCKNGQSREECGVENEVTSSSSISGSISTTTTTEPQSCPAVRTVTEYSGGTFTTTRGGGDGATATVTVTSNQAGGDGTLTVTSTQAGGDGTLTVTTTQGGGGGGGGDGTVTVTTTQGGGQGATVTVTEVETVTDVSTSTVTSYTGVPSNGVITIISSVTVTTTIPAACGGSTTPSASSTTGWSDSTDYPGHSGHQPPAYQTPAFQTSEPNTLTTNGTTSNTPVATVVTAGSRSLVVGKMALAAGLVAMALL